MIISSFRKNTHFYRTTNILSFKKVIKFYIPLLPLYFQAILFIPGISGIKNFQKSALSDENV